MRRKAAGKNLKAIAGLRSFIKANRECLSRRLAGRPAAPREPGFGYRRYFDHMDAELDAAARQLEASEDAYAGEKAQLAALRHDHRQSTSELWQLQSDVKRLLDGILPYGLEGTLIAASTPRDAVELAGQVRDTVALLRDVERFAPGPVAGITFDSEALAAKLETGRQQLEASIVALEEARVGLTGSGSLADDAVAEAARVCLAVARSVDGLNRLASES